ncbi:MAG TPA: caspase family protein [Jiangellaceae bacterium]
MTGARKALIIACGRYENEGLRQLPAPAADAAALSRVLSDAQIGAFDVHVVENEPAHVVKVYVEDLLSDARPDDVLLLHFSGHGLKSESGELYFAARDTRPNRLASTAVAADFVERAMRGSRSRSIVLFLDCCYGGAFGRGMRARAVGDANVLDSFPGTSVGTGRGRAVITASNAMEYAFEGDALTDDHSERPSVFTTALVQGLATGEADRDEDGWVSLNELYDYVFDRVREQNPHQTPSRDIQMQGELYLARSRRRKVRAAPIPPDLQAATTDANMFTRIGAVSELRARLASDDLAVAAGAYDALTDIARNDIKYVADAAAAAMDEVALRVPESALHFGEVGEGESAERTIQLNGPPLARTCTVEASQSWIRTEEVDEGVRVSVDTSRPGRLQGSMVIKGPTGEATVDVDVEIVAAPTASRGEHEPAEAQPAGQRPIMPTAPPAESPTVDPLVLAAQPTDTPVPSTTRRDRRRDVAGVSAIASALLLFLSGFSDYISGSPISDWPDVRILVLLSAVVAFTGGVLMFVPRTRSLFGPGFVLGAATVAAYGIVANIAVVLFAEPYEVNGAFWLITLGALLLITAGVAALLSVRHDVRVGSTPHGRLQWLIGVIGVLIALVLVFRAVNYGAAQSGHIATPSVVMALLAVAVLWLAAGAVPRVFGTALLAGWLAGGIALVLHYDTLDEQLYDAGADSGPTVLFALLLFGLLVATIFFARAGTRPSNHSS